MPRTLSPRRPPREQVTAEILEAAIGLFAKRGFEATTMQDVAAQVGMTAPALYYYFDSKQALLFEVIELNLERILERLEAALAAVGGTATERLQAFVRTHLAFQLEKVERARVYNAMFLGTEALLSVLSGEQRAAILRLQSRVRAMLGGILERGVARREFSITDMTVTTMGILALGEFVPAWFQPRGGLERSHVADRYSALALRMVRSDR